jgi:N-acetylmuramoyl-L-alanine amidase
VQEKNVNLAVALGALPLLRAEGFTVVLSRNADTLVTRTSASDFASGTLTAAAERKDAQARVACANFTRAQVLIVIHLNAYADPTTNGAATVYDSARPFHASSERLALLVQQDLLNQFHTAGWPVPDRGVEDDRAAVDQVPTAGPDAEEHLLEIDPSGPQGLQQPSAMPGALAEPLFVTHPAEADVAVDPKGVHAMAAGLSDAVAAFFGPSKPTASATP